MQAVLIAGSQRCLLQLATGAARIPELQVGVGGEVAELLRVGGQSTAELVSLPYIAGSVGYK